MIPYFLVALLSLLTLSPVYAEEAGKAEVLFKEAIALFEGGNTERATEVIKESITADPNNPAAHERLGYMLLQKGQLDASVNAFNSALKMKPDLRTAKTGLGLALLKKGDVKTAEPLLLEALVLNPYPSMTHYALGLLYEKNNDYEKAVNHFKEGVRTYKSGKR